MLKLVKKFRATSKKDAENEAYIKAAKEWCEKFDDESFAVFIRSSTVRIKVGNLLNLRWGSIPIEQLLRYALVIMRDSLTDEARNLVCVGDNYKDSVRIALTEKVDEIVDKCKLPEFSLTLDELMDTPKHPTGMRLAEELMTKMEEIFRESMESRIDEFKETFLKTKESTAQ